MTEFFCQMVDYDAPDEWTPIHSYCSEAAAGEYADICDDRSAGEVFTANDDQRIILVKLRPENEPLRYAVTFDFVKRFHAEPVTG